MRTNTLLFQSDFEDPGPCTEECDHYYSWITAHESAVFACQCQCQSSSDDFIIVSQEECIISNINFVQQTGYDHANVIILNFVDVEST